MTNPHESVALDYAAPTVRRRHSAFAIAGFTVALLAAAVPASMIFVVWMARRNGSSGSMLALSIGYYALPATAVVLAIRALVRRSRRSLAVIAIVLAVVATCASIWLNGRVF